MTPIIDASDTLAIGEQIKILTGWQQDQAVTVALVYGGLSAEDQLYIASSPPGQLSVTALAASLTQIGARFAVLDPCDLGFIPGLCGFDVILSNLHGPYGEDGRLQGLLDYLRQHYCGSGVAASAIAADKILCKRFMQGLGIPTPRWQEWTGQPMTWPGQPVMIKPAQGGSSVGMSLVRSEAELTAALSRANASGPASVLAEEYIPGLPVTVGLLELPAGILVFPPLAIHVHSGDFYDAAAKLDAQSHGTVTACPADLSPAVLDAVTRHARALWDGLGCHGMARIDFIVPPSGTPQALEVNTTPGLSQDSNFITAAGLCQLSHADVVRAILREALLRPPYDVPLPAPDFTRSPPLREPAG